VQDLNGSNYYNTTEGNIYANVMNFSIIIWGSSPSGISGLFIGTSSSYNNTTSLSKFSCSFAGCADYAPLTQIKNTPPVAGSIVRVNASVGHWFSVEATATDGDGATNITVYNITSSLGSCGFIIANATGNNLTVKYNCTSLNNGTASIVVTFADSYASTSNNTSNSYPDNAPTVTAPTISLPLYTSSIAECLGGTFSDVDGDLEDTGIRAFTWRLNGMPINSSGATLNISTLGGNAGENLSCAITVFTTNWALNGTNVSANETISSDPTQSSGGGTSPFDYAAFAVEKPIDRIVSGTNLTLSSVWNILIGWLAGSSFGVSNYLIAIFLILFTVWGGWKKT
jgi:hypothetical protein